MLVVVVEGMVECWMSLNAHVKVILSALTEGLVFFLGNKNLLGYLRGVFGVNCQCCFFVYLGGLSTVFRRDLRTLRMGTA